MSGKENIVNRAIIFAASVHEEMYRKGIIDYLKEKMRLRNTGKKNWIKQEDDDGTGSCFSNV